MIHTLLEAWLRGPDHPVKLRLFRWLVKLLPNSQIRISLGESKLAVSIDEFIGSRIIYGGIYEERTLRLAQDLMKGGGLFIDIGSNFGLYAVLLSEIESTHVIAVEPDELNFAQLKKNVINNKRSNISLCNIALSSSDAILPFEIPTPTNLGTVRVAPPAIAVAADRRAIVYRSATTFRRLAKALNVGEIKLIKMDVEGHELSVLQGMDWLSENHKPQNIICEFQDHSMEYDGTRRQDVYRFLVSKGYEAFDVAGNSISCNSDTIEENAWFRL
jgi:FkbM family methyltransferase